MRDHVLGRAGLRPESEPRLIHSDSNETWRFDDARLGPVVLRIAWRGDVTRLLRESAVGSRLPAEVPYPEVLGDGRTEYRGRALTWTVTRRLDGMTLTEAWPLLPARRRRAAAAELVGMLRTLHAWRPPKEVVDALLPRAPYDPGDRSDLIGGDLNPLPVERVRALLPHVDAASRVRVADALAELAPFAPSVDDPDVHGLVHGDLHPGNVWWTGGPDGRIGALLDLEWVRFGTPLLDLQRLLDHAHLTPELPDWLRADYPEWFADEHLDERLRLIGAAFELRQAAIAAEP